MIPKRTTRRKASRTSPPKAPLVWRLAYIVQVTAFISVLVAIGFGARYLLDPEHFPIENVQIVGELNYLDKNQLTDTIASHVQSGFFGLSVQRLQRKVKQFAWVEKVNAKRVWPNRLVVEITERKPRAFWGATGIISSHGELFFPPTVKGIDGLPVLEGPSGRHNLVWQNYLAMEQVLNASSLKIKSLQLAQRGAWEINLDNNIKVVLGTQEVLTRLRRFVRAYDKLLSKQQDNISYVDLRYTSGMAVGRKNGFE